MDNSLVLVGIILAVWLAQGLAVFRQSRRVYARLNTLRRLGRLAVGSAKNRWGARFYAVLVADPKGRILVAEHLAGVTVFAQLKPVQGFVGLTVEELLRESERVGREDRLGRLSLAAFHDAGERLLAAVRSAAAAPAADENPAR